MKLGDSLRWTNETAAPFRVVFPDARSLILGYLENFSVVNDEMASDAIDPEASAGFCIVRTGRFPYEVRPTDAIQRASSGL